MQEMFANDVQVEMIEAQGADYHYKSMTAISTTGAVQKEWQTPRAKRVREVLSSTPDPITGSQRELPQQQQHVQDEHLVYLDNQGLTHIAEN